MKKKLLFVIPSLEVGGAEKSLINLLNEIDYSLYEVDLFLMSHSGLFMAQVPSSVNMLPESTAFRNFSRPFLLSLLNFLKKGQIKLFWNKIKFTLVSRIYRNQVHAEQKSWKYLKHFFPILQKGYDVAIGYLEKNANYIVADRVDAKRKIGWIHTDLKSLGLNISYEQTHFRKLDYIVTVSDGLTARLKVEMPKFQKKIRTVENINSRKVIQKLSREAIDITFDPAFTNIIFVGRLEKVKGLALALDAISVLVKKNYNVRFYLIGDGSEKETLLAKAKMLMIENHVFFLGMKANPYPYISKADIYILTSHYEGKSISLEEAKILQKPIVITDFSSASDQIEDGITGLIAKKSPQSIAENIEKFITDKPFAKSLSEHLEKEKDPQENEIQKLYDLIES